MRRVVPTQFSHHPCRVGRKLGRQFYQRDAVAVARDLLGMCLCIDKGQGVVRSGRIVEVEAYQGPEDLAAHSARGRRTARTEVMFGPAGHALSISFINRVM